MKEEENKERGSKPGSRFGLPIEEGWALHESCIDVKAGSYTRLLYCSRIRTSQRKMRSKRIKLATAWHWQVRWLGKSQGCSDDDTYASSGHDLGRQEID